MSSERRSTLSKEDIIKNAVVTVKFSMGEKTFCFFTTVDGIDIYIDKRMLIEMGASPSELVKGVKAMIDYNVLNGRTCRIHSIADKSVTEKPAVKRVDCKKSGRKTLKKGAVKKGRIVRYIEERGFGFIEVKGYSDVWFHITQVVDELTADFIEEGVEVTFAVIESDGKDGIQAVIERVYIAPVATEKLVDLKQKFELREKQVA